MARNQEITKKRRLWSKAGEKVLRELPLKPLGKPAEKRPVQGKRITGVDLTRIDGVDGMVAQTLVSEVGLNMSRWKTEAHFASWLGLCPSVETECLHEGLGM